MQDLLIVNKFPTEGKSKTRLGKQIGYDSSSQIARLLLEDLIHNASQVCAVTIVSPIEDVDKFKTEYPEISVYGAPNGLIPSLSCSIKHQYLTQKSGKVIAITGDIVSNEEEINGWFNDLSTHDLLVGPTQDLRLYLAGLDYEFGEYFSQELSANPSLRNFLYACFRGISHLPRTKIGKIKRDIDTLDDLRNLPSNIPAVSDRTRDYARVILERFNAASSRY